MTENLPDRDRNKSEILFYQAEDGKTRLNVRLENETVWLTQDQMAELFEKAKSTINEHIKNIYEENELEDSKTMRKFGNSEFSTKPMRILIKSATVLFQFGHHSDEFGHVPKLAALG